MFVRRRKSAASSALMGEAGREDLGWTLAICASDVL